MTAISEADLLVPAACRRHLESSPTRVAVAWTRARQADAGGEGALGEAVGRTIPGGANTNGARDGATGCEWCNAVPVGVLKTTSKRTRTPRAKVLAYDSALAMLLGRGPPVVITSRPLLVPSAGRTANATLMRCVFVGSKWSSGTLILPQISSLVGKAYLPSLSASDPSRLARLLG